MTKGIFTTILLTILLPILASSQVGGTEKINLKSDWTFLKSDLGGIWESVRVPQAGQPTNFPTWESVELPHCFNAFDAVDPNQCYYQGPGWYRTLLTVDQPFSNGRTFLYFEGAGQKTDVYVGLTKVGSHVGGYDAWHVDITDALLQAKANDYIQKNYKGQIPVSIRCDNSRDLEMIPSSLSDFHVYGGLYRPVYLVFRPSNWFESLKISAQVDVKGKFGKVVLQPIVGQVSVDAHLAVKVRDNNGEIVFAHQYNGSNEAIQFEIAKPQLWSPATPNLYTVQVEANFDGQHQLLTDKFGFRQFEFQKNGPFFLNGERLLLKGTHRHEDFAGVGAAETEPMLLAEMQLIKAMGANFIRLGHYQQSKRVLELCDSLGILVWEEIPWCRGGLGGTIYKEQARRMLQNMITQHYNHPSIILWGMGNENDWPGDFETFSQDSIRAFMTELNALSHQLDPSRVTSIRRCDFCKDIVDVYSPSIWPGWYRGRYTDYYRVTKFEKEHTDRFLHVEWGADSHVGRHTETNDETWKMYNRNEFSDDQATLSSMYSGGKNMAKEGDWSESYAADLFDWTLTEQNRMPWLSGTAIWTFKDFATPIRPENPIPYVNQKGLVERDLTPKEAYYVVQAHWGNQPMIHIYGHSWPIRFGAVGELKTVKVFANCDDVELIVNGKSLGSKKRDLTRFPAMGLTWDVFLTEGKNEVKAIGKSKGKIITDELTWGYQPGTWGEVVQVKLIKEPIDAETCYLKATAVDVNGKVCLDSKLTVEFSVMGDARLNLMQGTSTGSHIIQLANGQAKIKVFKTEKPFTAAVKAEGLGWFSLQ